MMKRETLTTALASALTAALTAAMLTACGSNAGNTSDNTDIQTADSSSSYNVTDVVNADDAANGAGFTDKDRERQYLAYLENYLKEDVLIPLDDIKDAAVTLSAFTDTDNTLMNADSEINIAVVLDLENELTAYSADELAEILAKGVGNESTDNIVIMDSDGNQLFPDEI